MDLKTNVERVKHLLFHICGCNKTEAMIVLKTTLREVKDD